MDDLSRPQDVKLRRKVREIARVVPRVYRFLWETAPVLFVVACALMVVVALIPAAMLYVTKVIVDGVVDAAARGGSWTELITPVALMFGLWLSETLLNAVTNPVQSILSQRVYYAAQERVIEKAGALDIAFFESPKFYDQLRHAQDQLYQVESVVWSTISLLRNGVGLTAIMGLLTILHPFAIVVLIATVLPALLMQGYFARKHFDFDAEWIRNNRMLGYLVRLMTSRDSAKEIRVFTLGDTFASRYKAFRERHLRASIKLWIDLFKVRTGLDVISLAGVAAIWAYAVHQAVLARITIGDLTLVFNAAQQGRGLLMGLVGTGGQVYENALFVTRFFDLVDMDPQSVDASLRPPPRDPVPFPRRIEQGVAFKNVSFKYPGSDAWVLRDVSFEIPPRGKLAIVGENGAGKTTLVKLLSRLYDPAEGEVLLDGRDLRDYRLDDVRREVAVVFQDFFRYDLSAADNIGFGEVRALDDRDRIRTAATDAGAHDTIDALPKGYDTVLGKTSTRASISRVANGSTWRFPGRS